MSKVILTQPPIYDVATTAIGALRQMGDIFRNTAQAPKVARWRAHLAMAHAAASLKKPQPYIHLKAAALAAGLELDPNNSRKFLSPLQRTNWVEKHLLAAYLLPHDSSCFVPQPDRAQQDIMQIVRLSQDTGVPRLTLLMNGVLAKHFGVGEDPIAARLAVMRETPPPAPPAAAPAPRPAKAAAAKRVR